jgi:hypothetical protein
MQINQQRYLNGGAGDSVIGGALSSVPTAVGASQGIQDVPGDRIIFGMADALALSNTSIGTLYGGLYQYVRTKSNSTNTPTLGRLLFWDNTVNYNLYQTTPDEVTGQKAGFSINTLTKGYSWWMQICGIVNARYRATITGTPTVGRGVFALMGGAGSDSGTLEQLVGASTTVTTGGANNVGVDTLMANYAGVAIELPTNGGLKQIEVPFGKVRF